MERELAALKKSGGGSWFLFLFLLYALVFVRGLWDKDVVMVSAALFHRQRLKGEGDMRFLLTLVSFLLQITVK